MINWMYIVYLVNNSCKETLRISLVFGACMSLFCQLLQLSISLLIKPLSILSWLCRLAIVLALNSANIIHAVGCLYDKSGKTLLVHALLFSILAMINGIVLQFECIRPLLMHAGTQYTKRHNYFSGLLYHIFDLAACACLSLSYRHTVFPSFFNYSANYDFPVAHKKTIILVWRLAIRT